MPVIDPPTPATPILSATVLSGLFAKIDRNFSITNLADLYRVSGADEAQASFSLFNMLRRIILGDTSALPTSGEGADAAQQAALDRLTTALDTGAFTGRMVSLVGQTGQQVATLAASHMGVRFSLGTGIPFAIIGATDVYARHNQDGSLTRFDPATGATLISEEWLGDRSQLFAARLASGGASAIAITGNQSWVIDDRSQRNADGSSVRTALNADGANRPTGRVTFGADNSEGEIVAGGDGDDELDGGTGTGNMLDGGRGNDTLYSHGTNDILSGAEGDDILFGSDTETTQLSGGTGNDEIYGGAANDLADGEDGNDFLYGGHGDREAGVSFDRTASAKRLPRACASLPRTRSGGIRDGLQGGVGNSRDMSHADVTVFRCSETRDLQGTRMATLTSGVFINAFNSLDVFLIKTEKSPFHGQLQAKETQSARPDCTLPISAKISQKHEARIAANNLLYASAA